MKLSIPTISRATTSILLFLITTLGMVSVTVAQNLATPMPPETIYVYNNTDSSVYLNTPSGDLAGTLTLPIEKVKGAVLIIAGSGPTDRNGNGPMYKNNALKYLADTLTRSGFAVLRYDKRGIGESKVAGKEEKDMRFEDMILDASAWLLWLKHQYPEVPITVAGHSEGALVGLLAAKKQTVSGYISICGPAFPADSILKEQLYSQSPLLGDYCSPKLDSIKNGLWVTEKNPLLQSIFRESVQPYLHSWMQFDPMNEIKGIEVKALIIGGGQDLQVPTRHAEILANNAPKAEVVIIPELNHVLKKIEGNRMANSLSYNQPQLPIHPDLSKAILEYLSSL